jgi:hypothetical protein
MVPRLQQRIAQTKKREKSPRILYQFETLAKTQRTRFSAQVNLSKTKILHAILPVCSEKEELFAPNKTACYFVMRCCSFNCYSLC